MGGVGWSKTVSRNASGRGEGEGTMKRTIIETEKERTSKGKREG